ncbi:MAG: ABC transporter permease [Bacteroidales bacterium]|nr:ABC transporter permease [Bacteroidales bacterium]
MSLIKLVIASIRYYFKSNMLIALGMAVSTAIITGAFIVGDSVSYSLDRTVYYRLGNITHSITAGDRYFSSVFARRMEQGMEYMTSAGLIAEGMGLADGGQLRLENLQILGVDEKFQEMSIAQREIFQLQPGEVVISENVAARLNLDEGDMLLLRIKKASLIPLNTPLVSDADQTVARQVTIKAIVGREDFGRFNLQATQTAPFNVFIGFDWLNDIMDLEQKSNIIFISTANNDAKNEIAEKLRRELQIEDANLQLQYLPEKAVWELISERVFINSSLSEKLLDTLPSAVPFLTYFVNSMRHGDGDTPYSFVSSMPDSLLSGSEIIVNQWLADDIQARPGDTLSMEYFEIGPLRELEVCQTEFIVKEIIPVLGSYGDESLVPDLPGLSDAGSCREWEAGIPIELERIRDKDEEYWNRYRGTPKAFISISRARELWSNRFGDYTAIRVSSGAADEQEIMNLIKNSTDPFSLGFRVNELKKGGIQAAQNGYNFTQLFLGLSFFILVSGVILAALLVIFNLEHRIEQIGSMAAVGFSGKMIRKIYLTEGMLVALLGSLVGILLAVLYGKLVFIGLNRVWQDIVRTDLLEMVIRPLSLAEGFIISMVVSWLVIMLLLRRQLKFSITQLQKKTIVGHRDWVVRLKQGMMVALVLVAAGLLLWQFFSGKELNSTVFLGSGAMLLIGFLLMADLRMLQTEEKPIDRMNMRSLSYKNLVRNRTRSLTVIILLSLGTFTVISTGSNRANLAADAQVKSSGTGGFLFLAESTVPILKNLNDPDIKNEFGIPDSLEFIQFRTYDGDDASCLNLNRVTNPRVLGVDPDALKDRFSFVTVTEFLDESDPWASLEKDLDDVIPVVADQTIIQWGLGMKMGDTLHYVSERGDSVRLKLIGGLANSIFQGNVIISADNFLQLFPSSVGTSFLLMDGAYENRDQLAEELNFAFRDFGWDMVPAVERLAEYASVQNTYLQIFLVMGAFGLLLGTVGLAIVLARSIYERRNELAVMLSAGYRFKQLFGIILREYNALLLAGIASGLLASVIATLPAFLSGYQNVSFSLLTFLTGIIILNGFFWIMLVSAIQLRNLNLLDALRND